MVPLGGVYFYLWRYHLSPQRTGVTSRPSLELPLCVPLPAYMLLYSSTYYTILWLLTYTTASPTR